MNKIVVSNNIKNPQIKSKKDIKFKIYLGNIIDFEKYPAKIGPAEIENFSDHELYDYCRFTGINARIWSRRFIAAIPEVARRCLYIKHGFYSIYEFASKVGGITNNTVNIVLWLNNILKDKPGLRALIGEVGINKIRVVVKIATKETEKFWIQKVREMSKPALEVLVREIKQDKEAEIIRNNNPQICSASKTQNEHGEQPGVSNTPESDNNLLKSPKYPGINLTNDEKDGSFNQINAPYNETQEIQNGGLFKQIELPELENQISVFKKPERINFSVPIDKETEFRLRKFKLDLEKKRKEPVDWNRTLKELTKLNNNICL